MALNLRAKYTPNEDGKSETVTIIAVISSDQELNPSFLAINEQGKFLTDSIDRFVHQGQGWLYKQEER